MARIMFLTPKLPYPPISGGIIKSYKLVEFLSAKHEVHLFCLLKGEDPAYIDEFRAAVSLAGFHCVPLNILRSVKNYLRSIVAMIPLSVYRNRSSEMELLVSSAIGQVDVIFVDHFLMFQYVPKYFNGRIILHQHNAEYVMWKRYAVIEKNLLKKLTVYLESRRIMHYESNICKRCNSILASPNDIEALRLIGIPRKLFKETLHLGDEKLLDYQDINFKETNQRLLFVGTLDWQANRDGLLWFLREVWPILKKKYAGLCFTIIGRNPGDEISQQVGRYEGVELLGFVDDLEPHYSRSRVFVAPLRFGSGIKVKVINALYRGLPVSTTSIGIEGINVDPGHNIFVADEVGQMAQEIGILLTCEDVWTKIRDAGRALARKEYTWKVTLMRVEEAING